MDPVQHFELPYRSRERAKKFYFDAFGWQLFDLPGSGYTLASSVATHKNGMPVRPGAINGGLVPRDELVQGPTFMAKVGNLAAHLERIREHGGDVLTDAVHMGPVVYARIRDTEGNVLAVFENAATENAGAPKKATGKAAPRKAAKKAPPKAKPARKGKKVNRKKR